MFAMPMLKAFQDFGEPVGSLAAGRTFAARLVAIELRHAQHGADDAGIFVHDDDAAGAEHRAGGGNAFKVERRIHFVRVQV